MRRTVSTASANSHFSPTTFLLMRTLTIPAAIILLFCLQSLPQSQAQSGDYLQFTTSQNDQVSAAIACPSGAFTLEAWVYYDAASFPSGYVTIIEFEQDNPWFGVFAGKLHLFSGYTASINMPVNAWVHVAFTWDGTTGYLYQDGVVVASNTASFTSTGLNFGIGKNTGDIGWQGRMDEIMVWGSARSDAEIAMDMGGGTSPDVAYFRFNEGSGQDLNNESGGTNAVLGFSNSIETNDPEWGIGLLPVEWLHFHARLLDGGDALLEWATASESENEGFFVEKSEDGIAFSGIGFVPGKGNAEAENHYHFNDNKLLPAGF